jgi:hypothetical protein
VRMSHIDEAELLLLVPVPPPAVPVGSEVVLLEGNPT